LILDASSAPIKKETTPEQKKKVEALIKADAVRRRAEKTHRSDVKKGRRDGDWF
jgi:peptidyl-tRNA hydrolase ICT1